MASIIGMAYSSFGADIHFGPTAARRIEEIRRLAIEMSSSPRRASEHAEAQMLTASTSSPGPSSSPTCRLPRPGGLLDPRAGRPRAQVAAAGGTAIALVDLGDVQEAEAWLDRAAAAAAASPTPYRARQLELWRGQVAGAAGDAGAMRTHLERVVEQSTNAGVVAPGRRRWPGWPSRPLA